MGGLVSAVVSQLGLDLPGRKEQEGIPLPLVSQQLQPDETLSP